nr:MAG TPA: hypothetical protein [Caudoviricetes sp.]
MPDRGGEVGLRIGAAGTLPRADDSNAVPPRLFPGQHVRSGRLQQSGHPSVESGPVLRAHFRNSFSFRRESRHRPRHDWRSCHPT